MTLAVLNRLVHSISLEINMKEMANDLILKALRTPAIAEQIRKSLVNRDISINIDGKEYQIMKKNATQDDLTKLKAEIWDLRNRLGEIKDSLEDLSNVSEEVRKTYKVVHEPFTKALSNSFEVLNKSDDR